jgi:hypothetical protein
VAVPVGVLPNCHLLEGPRTAETCPSLVRNSGREWPSGPAGLMGSKIKTRTDAAIRALLESETLADAAHQCGVSDRTLRRWMDRDDFRAAFREASQRSYDAAVGRLKALAVRAVATLARALEGNATGVQVRAALGIFDVIARADMDMLRAALDDLFGRIDKLERPTTTDAVGFYGQHNGHGNGVDDDVPVE